MIRNHTTKRGNITGAALGVGRYWEVAAGGLRIGGCRPRSLRHCVPQ